jgi:hypothetical protein
MLLSAHDLEAYPIGRPDGNQARCPPAESERLREELARMIFGE